MTLAPIALFVYKRPDHTRRTLEALAECELASQSKLFIFSDGPKTIADEAGVAEVRRLARSRAWCGEVEVVEQERNRGLANSVIAGVTELCEKFGRVIVMEDDLVVSPYFLKYMNDALDRYAGEPKVMQVSGHMYDVELPIGEDALFLPFTTSWGWGTWKRAWDLFDPDARGLGALQSDWSLRKRFNLGGAHDYFSMLQRQQAGQIDSWAIRWYVSVFMSQGLVLFPKVSLVHNIGFDGTGTHCAATDKPAQANFAGSPVGQFPESVRLSNAFDTIVRHVRQSERVSPMRRLARTIRSAGKQAFGAN
jgi:hypothetical protein